jgi:predicted glycosyl hydrolase (DUF1957 family)
MNSSSSKAPTQEAMTPQQFYDNVWLKRHYGDFQSDWPMRFAEAWANHKNKALLGLIQRVAEHCSDNLPDKDWFRDLYRVTGEHMILTEDGWQPASEKTGLVAEYGADHILDEVNG